MNMKESLIEVYKNNEEDCLYPILKLASKNCCPNYYDLEVKTLEGCEAEDCVKCYIDAIECEIIKLELEPLVEKYGKHKVIDVFKKAYFQK